MYDIDINLYQHNYKQDVDIAYINIVQYLHITISTSKLCNLKQNLIR